MRGWGGSYIGTVQGQRIGSGGSNAVCLAGTSDNGEFAGEILVFGHCSGLGVGCLIPYR